MTQAELVLSPATLLLSQGGRLFIPAFSLAAKDRDENAMSKTTLANSAGYVTITLHSHLPYVVNHGTWPHGLEWLCEAAAETYLPLLRIFAELERDNVFLKPNINLSPILLEQLAHPVFKREFVEYLNRKIEAARKDQEEYKKKGDAHMAHVAEYWQGFFALALKDFQALGQDIISGFRR